MALPKWLVIFKLYDIISLKIQALRVECLLFTRLNAFDLQLCLKSILCNKTKYSSFSDQ